MKLPCAIESSGALAQPLYDEGSGSRPFRGARERGDKEEQG
jgi:hypothetical protein